MRNAMLGALFLATVARAEVPPPPPPLEIHRITAPITVDGDLNDPGWRDAAKIDRFYETSPGDNTPPKVKTTAWLAYDDKYFYIAVRCDDPDASKIRAPFVERDAVIGTDDNVAVFLDTRNDKKSAMELRISPRGIQADGIFNDANGNEDFSPDFFYDTAAKIDSGGWSGEFRIPFSSLRYGKSDPQTWNILVWRNYPRDYRYAFHSAPIERGSNCLVCHTHPIVGLTHLPEAGHLVAAPYVTSQRTDTPEAGLGSSLGNSNNRNRTGIDVKWNASANGAFDLTFDPDFSQIETDTPQITVNQRFAVFFPEKRPFFLEGFDLFDTPIQVAYTRTITAPRWGVRSTGKFGNTAYTALVTDDHGGGLTVIPTPLGSEFAPQDFKSLSTIARLRHDIGKSGSFLGGVLTDRENSGGGHNRVLGPDFLWRPNAADAITAEFLYSDTENPNRPDLSPVWNGARLKSHAFFAGINHNVTKLDWGLSVKDVGRDFRADLGFIPQSGYRDYFGIFGLHFYPEHSKVFRYVRPSLLVEKQNDTSGNTIFRSTSLGVNGIGVKNLNFFVGFDPREQQFVGGKLLEQTYGVFNVQYDPSRRVPRVGVNITSGQSIDFSNARVGNGSDVRFFGTFRPIDKLTLDVTGERQWLDADGGRVFTATVERVRALYSFSSRSIVRVIGQYVKTDRDPALYGFPVPRHSGSFLGSVLYSYKVNWQTVLFVGYGDDRTLTANNDLLRADRSVFLKVSYAYQR
jgi:hypothetical protein